MVLRRLPDPAKLKPYDGVPSFADHCLFIEETANSLVYPKHFTGVGLIALLKGKGSFTVNDTVVRLDENSFVIVNRGSSLSFNLPKGEKELCLLYFDSILSEILSLDIFNKNIPIPDFEGRVDFSLLEHMHYQNASLKNHLSILKELGNSCASFHALKADMLVRSMLNDLVAENYDAMRTSAQLGVVRNATRVDLFKRLQLARQWMERNFADQVNLKQAADIAMLNQEHFLRMFKQAFKKTPHQYLTKVRILEAKKLLKMSNDSVSSICQQVGFESLTTFSGMFKEKVGFTPGQYRANVLQKNSAKSS